MTNNHCRSIYVTYIKCIQQDILVNKSISRSLAGSHDSYVIVVWKWSLSSLPADTFISGVIIISGNHQDGPVHSGLEEARQVYRADVRKVLVFRTSYGVGGTSMLAGTSKPKYLSVFCHARCFRKTLVWCKEQWLKAGATIWRPKCTSTEWRLWYSVSCTES